MKKILLPVLTLFAVGAYGQTYFTDDFASGIGAWTIYDQDGDTEIWEISNAAAYGSAVPFDGDFAQSRSWIGTPLTPDNYLVTTAGIVIPGAASNCILSWTTGTIQAAPWHEEEYTVYIATGSDLASATSGTAVFNEILPVGGEVLNRSVDLSAYIGTTVYVVFRHWNTFDMNMLVIDDVNVATLPDYELATTDVTLDEIVQAGTVNITGEITNNGALATTSFDIVWDDGTGPYTETVTTAIPSGGTYNFTHATTLTAVASNAYTVTVCAVIAGDADASNDCMTANLYCASGTGAHLVCCEIFTSSTCPPCFTFATTGYDGAGLGAGLTAENANAETGAGLSAIKYQVDWPGAGDHSWNAEVETRRAYYGVTGAPSALADGAMSAGWGDFNSAYVNIYKAKPAFLDIAATHTIISGTISVDVTVDPYANWTGASLYIALLDKQYDATGDPSFSNGQTDFEHIFRKMMPNAGGTPVSLTDGTQYTSSQSYNYTEVTAGTLPVQGSYDFHNGSEREVIVFIQDANGVIINSTVSVKTGDDSGIGEEDQNFAINVYPNPTNDFATIGITLGEASDVTFEVYNALGELVYKSNTENLSAGDYLHQIDVNGFAAGVYTVNTTVNDVRATSKLSVH